jgi:hypothetical protein
VETSVLTLRGRDSLLPTDVICNNCDACGDSRGCNNGENYFQTGTVNSVRSLSVFFVVAHFLCVLEKNESTEEGESRFVRKVMKPTRPDGVMYQEKYSSLTVNALIPWFS